jgi:hypothetical protein
VPCHPRAHAVDVALAQQREDAPVGVEDAFLRVHSRQDLPARTLREFTQEAVNSGLLQPVVLGEGDAQATTPGLGWRVIG